MAKEYTVLKIDELTRIGKLHGIEKYYRYTIETAKHNVLTIDIGEADSKLDKAAPILAARAIELDATMS